jgi:dTDP-D-glucose 4,6-dehydratase
MCREAGGEGLACSDAETGCHGFYLPEATSVKLYNLAGRREKPNLEIVQTICAVLAILRKIPG